MGKPNRKIDREEHLAWIGKLMEQNYWKILNSTSLQLMLKRQRFNHEEVFNLAKEYTTESMYYQAADFKNIDKHFLMNKPK